MSGKIFGTVGKIFGMLSIREVLGIGSKTSWIARKIAGI